MERKVFGQKTKEYRGSMVDMIVELVKLNFQRTPLGFNIPEEIVEDMKLKEGDIINVPFHLFKKINREHEVQGC